MLFKSYLKSCKTHISFCVNKSQNHTNRFGKASHFVLAIVQRLTKMKHGIIHCYTRVSWYCQKNEIKYENPNDLVLIGLWKKQFVFKLFAPENVEYIVIPDNTVLTDCFLCDSETDEVKYIK